MSEERRIIVDADIVSGVDLESENKINTKAFPVVTILLIIPFV